MTETEIARSFRVEYYDEYLEVDDFQMINAESEEDARSIFEDQYNGDDQYEVTNVEKAYELNKTKIEDLLGDVESI